MLAIEERLRDLPSPITILYYTPDVPSAATRAERELLEEIARSAKGVELRVLAERWDAECEARVGIARTPAIVLLGARDYGLRYYGVPDGYELDTFLSIVRAVAEGRSGLAAGSVARLRAVATPLHLEVLHAPT
jgi:hypothetical protein